MNIALPSAGVLARRLLWATAALHVLSLGSNAVYHGLGIHYPFAKFTWLTIFFNVDKEKNLPTWFSAAVLMLSACILWEVATATKASGDRYARYWRGLSIIFAMLSLDEVAQAHEIASRSELLTIGGASYLSWMVPVIPLVLVFGLSYLRFLTHLPASTRWRMVAAGCVFLGGAVGVEILGAFVGRTPTGQLQPGGAYLQYLVMASIEELLEMLGSILFMYTAATHLQHLRQRLPGVTRLRPARLGATTRPVEQSATAGSARAAG